MPKLSTDLRNKIIGAIEAGDKPFDISVRYGCHISSIYRLMNKFLTTGSADDLPKSGRPKVTTPRQDRAIATVFRREPFSTAAEVARTTIGTHGRPLSEHTVRRRIHAVGRYCRRPVKKPFLMAHHRRNRLTWAQLHLNWRLRDWRTVIFSDECRVCVDPDSGRVRVWRRVGERYSEQNILERDLRGGIHVMIWGAIGLNIKVGPIFFNFNDGNPGVGVTAQRYIDQILTPVVLPFFANHQNLLFMQDNATPHKARLTMDYLRQNNINLQPHPAKSPDLNPIEHFWDFLKRELRRQNPRPQNAADLQNAIQRAWERIPRISINNLVLSMPRRARAVFDVNGGHTKY